MGKGPGLTREQQAREAKQAPFIFLALFLVFAALTWRNCTDGRVHCLGHGGDCACQECADQLRENP